jgi:Replication-relaxation
VLAYDRSSTLWDAVRLLSVGEEGYAYRSSVGARVRTLPEFKEISEFFTAELSAQLADARSTTTAKLDAPVNKLARLLNSPSIKRVLLNESLRLDFDRMIAGEEVLVVKGALGAMGAGNTSVLMQLLVGMLDASLARQQDLLPQERRVAVALKIDEAPLVLNRGFAETMALKRSAGLETVACWQTDAQWVDREVREQLDALFAHRVYFATASASDARAAVALTMAEFSDTVRPGIRHLSALGHPDVRLHLPKHHAIASWVTEAGRQAPFVARTIPLQIDRERLALHAARQLKRGGRHLTDLHQPHWDRARRIARGGQAQTRATGTTPAPIRAAAEGAPPASDVRQAGEREAGAPSLPGAPAESYAELAAIDSAASVRCAKPISSVRAIETEPVDLEILALVAELKHVLTSQIHRRFNAQRSATTTQRRLKRLADADLLLRFQFHRRDGGGMPMCCVITPRGIRLLEAEGQTPDAAGAELQATVTALRRRGLPLRAARHDVHVAGWVLGFERVLGSRCRLLGADGAVISPPLHSGPDGRPVLRPCDLRLPGGRAPHDFLRTDASGERREVEHFDTLRPDAIVELRAGGAADLIIELDDRIPRGQAAAKLERYDHFLAGWSAHTRRYGGRSAVAPRVVFVCRSRARARECARAADSVLNACRAYAGEYPFDWEYPGRTGILFAAERDVHEGSLHAYGVAALPPEVRVTAARGDPRAGEAAAQSREIPTACEPAAT